MRSARGSAVTMGLMIVVAGGCRSESGRNVGQGGAEPIASSPTFPAVPGAEDQPSEPPAIGGGPAEQTTPAEAAAGLAAVKCDHYARCNDIGPNKKYKSRGECVSKMQSDQSKSINAKACPGGVNETNLKGCLHVLRDAKCGSPISTLERWESCKTDVICEK